jgi:hypothetical protein
MSGVGRFKPRSGGTDIARRSVVPAIRDAVNMFPALAHLYAALEASQSHAVFALFASFADRKLRSAS